MQHSQQKHNRKIQVLLLLAVGEPVNFYSQEPSRKDYKLKRVLMLRPNHSSGRDLLSGLPLERSLILLRWMISRILGFFSLQSLVIWSPCSLGATPSTLSLVEDLTSSCPWDFVVLRLWIQMRNWCRFLEIHWSLSMHWTKVNCFWRIDLSRDGFVITL